MKRALIVLGILVAAVGLWWLFLRDKAKAKAAGAATQASADRATGSTMTRATYGNAGALVPWMEPTSSPVSVWVGQSAVPTPTGGMLSPLQQSLRKLMV